MTTFEKIFFYRKNNKEKISYRNIGSYCNLNSFKSKRELYLLPSIIL